LKNVRSSTTDPKLLAALEYQLAANPEVIFLDKGANLIKHADLLRKHGAKTGEELKAQWK
jgi:hypothetical protein